MHIEEHEDQIQLLNARLERFQDAPIRPRINDSTMHLKRRIRNLPWMEEKKPNQVKAFFRHADIIHQSITEEEEEEDDMFLEIIRDKLAPCIYDCHSVHVAEAEDNARGEHQGRGCSCELGVTNLGATAKGWGGPLRI